MIICLFVANYTGIASIVNMVKNWWRYDSVPAYLASVALFVSFLNVKVWTNKKINSIVSTFSAATFGVYLIHSHADICIEKWWQAIGMIEFINNWWFVFYQLAIVVFIFIVCAVIDLIRKQLFKLLKIDDLVRYLFGKIQKLIIR